MKYYLQAFKKYATFNGRARRGEYWFFVLFNCLFLMVAVVLDSVIVAAVEGTTFLPVFSIIYVLVTTIPALAVTVRRLHDTGKSGWFYLVSLIPLIGTIWLFVLMVTEGDRGENKYGPDPKETTPVQSKPTGFNPEPGRSVPSPVINRSEEKSWSSRNTERVKSPHNIQEHVYGWLVQLFENNKPVVFPITQELTLIGRDPGTMGGQNGIFKIANDGTVSRKHAAIRVESKAGTTNFLLEDLGSANGTFVMNTRTKVQPLQPFYLTDGDKIKAGDTLLNFRTALAAPMEWDAINSSPKAVLNRV